MKIFLGLVCALLIPGMLRAADAASLYDIPLKDIDGKAASLKTYEGKVLLIVNVASKCGFTRQYEPLESIYRKYKERGFVVLGFPSNDFRSQEPGSNEEIKQFCSSKYNVTFPLFDKTPVKPGPDQNPLYSVLTGPSSPFPGPITWNFNKFLVSREGRIIGRFDSKDEPDSDKVTQAIEKALGAAKS